MGSQLEGISGHCGMVSYSSLQMLCVYARGKLMSQEWQWVIQEHACNRQEGQDSEPKMKDREKVQGEKVHGFCLGDQEIVWIKLKDK